MVRKELVEINYKMKTIRERFRECSAVFNTDNHYSKNNTKY